jgi:hypothetical protein
MTLHIKCVNLSVHTFPRLFPDGTPDRPSDLPVKAGYARISIASVCGGALTRYWLTA